MQGFSNRSIVVISGLLTLLVLGGSTLAVAFHHGWLHTTWGAPAPDVASPPAQSADIANNSLAVAVAPESPSAPSIGVSAQDDVAMYRQKLDEAYRALDDAYAQIRALQTPQTRFASSGDSDQRFAGQRERRSHRRDPDDE